VVVSLPALLHADAKEDEANKVSNDRPDRPLQMPPASSEAKEAFDDFERFARRSAWERALKSLYAIPEDQAGRFVDGHDGFIVPVAYRRRERLAGLPAEGQAAYRLFHDDDARKLLEQADGADELKILQRIDSAYFATSVGDNAADRLGDLYFEMGRFDRAADCWLAVLRERPDTDLAPALLAVKAALALDRAERRAELAALRHDIDDRYAEEKVVLGGRTATAADHLKRLLSDEHPTGPARSAAREAAGPQLSQHAHAYWQLRFGESITAGMTEPERVQWDQNPLSSAVPPLAVAGRSAYVNFLGYVFALDLASGKLLWRSASFHNVEVPAAQDQARMIDPARFGIVASEDHVWSSSRELKDPNRTAPFSLTCRRTDGGDVVWQSKDLPDYAQLDLVGTPLLAGGLLFVAARPPMQFQQGGPVHEHVLAIHPTDGRVRWKTEIGTFRQGRQYFYYGMRDNEPQPALLYRAGALYVDTHQGVLARLDAESGELEWGYGYQTEPVESSGRFFFWGMSQEQKWSAGGAPSWSGEALYVKGAKSDRIYALDPDRRQVLWDRPIAESARLLGSGPRAVYLGGPELSALELGARRLAWAARLPGGSGESRVLARPDGLWQFTARGVFEVDPRTGRVRRIFRGDDPESNGGDLYLTERWLLAVSDRAISAYPIAPVADRETRPAASQTRASDE
jgi:outer membrane protein assembly factor BamB